MKLHTKSLMAVAFGNIIWGFSFLFSRIALDMTLPSVLVAYRFAGAFIMMNIIVIVGGMIRKEDGSRLVEFSLKGKPLKDVLLLALFQPILYFFCETYGIYYTSSSFSGTIIAVIPIVGVVVDRVVMGNSIRPIQITCAVASVIGVIITTLGAEGMKSSLIGILFLLSAVLSSSLFYVFSKKSGEHYSAIERTYVMFLLGFIAFAGFALVQCRGNYAELLLAPASDGKFMLSILYLSVFASVVAFVCQNWGNDNVNVSESTLFANVTTVVSIFAGVIFLHESFTVQQIIGAAIIIASVYIAESRKTA